MEFNRNPKLEKEIMDRVRAKYLGKVRPEVPHLSELIGCLTRSYFDRISPLKHDNKTAVMFGIGWALEEVFLRDEESVEIPVSELQGIYMTPDYESTSEGEMDLKTTRMWIGEDGSPKKGFPDAWMTQFMAYTLRYYVSKYLGDNPELNEVAWAILPDWMNYSVGIVYLGAAEIGVGTITYTKEEIKRNWELLQVRKEVYMAFLKLEEVPTPFDFNQKWECDKCRYKGRCNLYVKGE